MSDIQYKSFDTAFRPTDDAGSFSAYVAHFSSIDRTNELIAPGAFKNLPAFISDGWVALSHDASALPIAMIESASQDSKGLLVNAKWHQHPAAQACRSVVLDRMQSGRSVKCSIGYRVLDSANERIDGKSVKILKSIDVFECSLVNLPANPLASVISAKSLDPDAPKLIAVDDLKSLLEEFKAGKVISKANYNKLKDMHAKLGDAHATLGSFLDQHDPDGGLDEPDDDSLVGGGGRVKGKAAQLKQLRLRVLRSRVEAMSLHRE